MNTVPRDESLNTSEAQSQSSVEEVETPEDVTAEESDARSLTNKPHMQQTLLDDGSPAFGLLDTEFEEPEFGTEVGEADLRARVSSETPVEEDNEEFREYRDPALAGTMMVEQKKVSILPDLSAKDTSLFLNDFAKGLENYAAKIDNMLEMHHKRNLMRWEAERILIDTRNKDLEDHFTKAHTMIKEKYDNYLKLIQKHEEENEKKLHQDYERQKVLQQQVFDAETQWHEIEKMKFQAEMSQRLHEYLRQQQKLDEAIDSENMDNKLSNAQYNLKLNGSRASAFVENCTYVEQMKMNQFLEAWSAEQAKMEIFLERVCLKFNDRLVGIHKTLINCLDKANKTAAAYHQRVNRLNQKLETIEDSCDTEATECYNNFTEEFTNQVTSTMQEQNRLQTMVEEMVSTKRGQVASESARMKERLEQKSGTLEKFKEDYYAKAALEYGNDLEDTEGRMFNERIAELTRQNQKGRIGELPKINSEQLARYREQVTRIWEALEVPDSERRKFLFRVEENIPPQSELVSLYTSEIGSVAALHLRDHLKYNPDHKTGLVGAWT